MANREACELYIEQEIEYALDCGKTPHAIGNELSAWVAKIFEVRINPGTLKARAARQKAKLGTNVSKQSKRPQTPAKREFRNKGGKRKGAGRPSTNELLIKLNQKLNELYEKEQECQSIEKEYEKEIKPNPDRQASIMYAVILGAIRIIETRIDLAEEKGTATYIPADKRVEITNRWNKISLFINEQIRRVNNEQI